MIIPEFLNNGTLVRQYSDKGVKLLQLETGMMYDDPIDIVPCPYTYEETSIPVGYEPEEEEVNEEERES